MSSKEHCTDQDLSQWTDQELIKRYPVVQLLGLADSQEIVRRHKASILNTRTRKAVIVDKKALSKLWPKSL